MLSYILSQNTLEEKLIAGVAYLLAIMIAIMSHEVAHGFVALKAGDSTAKDQGRLNFNPIKHFNLFGIIMFIFAGIGWANPVPVNPNNFNNYKRDMIKVSLAGVVCNFILSFISFGVLVAIFAIYDKVQSAYLLFFFLIQFFFIMTLINISLVAFNLIPVYPLDGFRLVETYAGIDNGYCRFMRKYGSYVFLAIVLIGNYIPQLDILGYYMTFIQKIILKLFGLIFGTDILG